MPPKTRSSKKMIKANTIKEFIPLFNIQKMKKVEDRVILGLSSLILLTYSFLNVCYGKYLELGLFLVFFIMAVVVTKDIVISLALAMIVSILLPKLLPSNHVVMAEGFTDVEQGPLEQVGNKPTGTSVANHEHHDHSSSTQEKTVAGGSNHAHEQHKHHDHSSSTQNTVAGGSNHEHEQHKHHDHSSSTESTGGGGGIGGFDDDDDNDINENYIDIGSSFLEAYKTLKPQQIEAMTNDTKELLATQKGLVEAMESLTPVVTEGKKMLETFKGFFPGQDISKLDGLMGGGGKK